MSGINFHTREISVKIVYYGPGLCGKTTTLQTIFGSLPEERRHKFVSLATEVDRTIFFDFLPVTAYRIRDFDVRLQLYTVPGQVFYNATRKLVLNGVDGVVFVADSQRAVEDSNHESLQNLDENLADLGMDITDLPMIIQANKRDLSEIHSLEEMDRLYNRRQVPFFGTVALTGEGIFDGLRAVSQLVVNNLVRKGLGAQLAEASSAPPVGGPPPLPSASNSATTVPAPKAKAFDGGARRVIKGAPPARRLGRDPAESTSPASPVAESIASSIAEVQETSATDTSGTLGLWPSGKLSELGEKIETAIGEGQWADAVLAAEALLKYQGERWAASGTYEEGDPVAAFLFLRGVSGARYRAVVQAAKAARTGRGDVVERSDAMIGLVLALEAVW